MRLPFTIRLAAGCLFLGWALCAHASPPASPLRICYEDVVQYPWTTPEGEGLNFVLMEMVRQKLQENFVMQARPWKRCLAYAANGEVDAVMGAADTPERRRYAVFPARANGEARTEARLYATGFHIFVRKGSAIQWDGKQFHHLHGTVAAQAGFITAERLRAMGLPLDDSSKTAENGLRLLHGGLVEAAVLQGEQALKNLQENPQFQSNIQVLPKPFLSLTMYLMVSKKIYALQKPRIDAIWQAIEQVRSSESYLQQERAAGTR